ncbi:MAG: cation-transporting P-type ATPase, partial [Lachnospiraceae bacterium]|nr:cation-transporting P-type ATPase [Lachnospiraceae bacterium]
MIKRINDFLAGLPMTIVGGVFLVMSFVFPRTAIILPGNILLSNILPFDPAWVTVFICGIPLLYLAVWRIIYNKGISKISSALLISIAMIAAIAIGDLFAACEVAFIMEIGAILENMTTDRAKKGLKKLISLTPTQGRRITYDKSMNGLEEIIPADKILQNDILRVLPGETIPVDGIIIQGETSIDQSIMTGESLPV